MTSAYQPTTVRNDEIYDDESTAFCNPFHSRRHHDFQNGDNRHVPGQESDGDRQERVNHWLFTRCVSRQDGQTSQASSVAPTPVGSELHIPGRTATSETVPPSKLNLAQTLQKYVPFADDITIYNKVIVV